MKHKTVMIGLGTISLDHKKGVESSPFLAISAVCLWHYFNSPQFDSRD